MCGGAAIRVGRSGLARPGGQRRAHRSRIDQSGRHRRLDPRVQSVRGIAIPAIGAIDDAGAGVLKSATVTKAVSSAATTPDRDPDPSGRYQVSDIRVQTTDAPVTRGAGRDGHRAHHPVLTPSSQLVGLDRESAVSRRQSATAALAFAALTLPHSGAATTDQQVTDPQVTQLPVSGRSQFIVPPIYWSPHRGRRRRPAHDGDRPARRRAAHPEGLPRRGHRTRHPPGGSVGCTLHKANQPLPRLVGGLPCPGRGHQRAHRPGLRLQASLVRSADVEATPGYLAPLRGDLLRSLRSPDHDTASGRTALGAIATDGCPRSTRR